MSENAIIVKWRVIFGLVYTAAAGPVGTEGTPWIWAFGFWLMKRIFNSSHSKLRSTATPPSTDEFS